MVFLFLGMFVFVCECGNVLFVWGLLMCGFIVFDVFIFLIVVLIVNLIVIFMIY